MTQKIIKVGNSLAVTLPAKFVKELRVKAGDMIKLETNSEHKVILISFDHKRGKQHPSYEFFQWLEDFTRKHDKILKTLARV